MTGSSSTVSTMTGSSSTVSTTGSVLSTTVVAETASPDDQLAKMLFMSTPLASALA